MAKDARKDAPAAALELVRKLREIFQLDAVDIDFGIYRIIRQRHDEIVRFLEDGLISQVREAFAQYRSADKTAVEKQLQQAIKQAEDLGVNPDTTAKVKELRVKLASSVDLTAVENEVFSALYTFFGRYYKEGDFISQRRYKDGIYAIPYEGEEVKLYWANQDQYYVKTSEFFHNYSFTLPSGRTVRFMISPSSADDKKGALTSGGAERRFLLKQDAPVAANKNDLVIHFEFRADPDKNKQEDLNKDAVERILSTLDIGDWIKEISTRAPTESNPHRTLLEKHLSLYAARNTFDYFVHKDLKSFLRRELDFFIKNEIVHLDDVESQTPERAEQYLSKVKVLRAIATKIIEFLAQLEDFQKKLWLKKKFVIETNYCFTLDRIPEEFYPEISKNDAQREEWLKLFAIDEIKGTLRHKGYSKPATVEFLKANPHLVLDTRHFDSDFRLRLLAALPSLDDQIDGLVIQGDNFHALGLLEPSFRTKVDCIYIDPPFNTGDSTILYKNNYLFSSWLTLMAARLSTSIRLLSDDPVMFIAIDDFELADLCKLIDSHYGSFRREMIVVNHHPQGGKAKTLANTHEYMLVCVPKGSDRTLTGRLVTEHAEERPFKRSGTAVSNFRQGRPNSFYALLVDPKTKEVVGAEPPPKIGETYPTKPTAAGLLRVYPLGASGDERVWRRSYESSLPLIQAKKLKCSDGLTIYHIVEAGERTPALFSNWVGPRYNAGTMGANLLEDILGAKNAFPYPKSLYTVEDALFSADLSEGAVVLDFFAGSGTTAHAVIDLNRADDNDLKYILVEMGTYFDTVLIPRIKKVIYSENWKDGRPVDRKGLSHAFKYIRLESYEDALDNLELKRSERQQTLLERDERVREQYLLGYMLDLETRGSASLLDTAAFVDPFDYKLRITRNGVMQVVRVDLVETFNFLLGVRAERIETIDGVMVVQGINPESQRVLLIWRNVKEIDADALDRWFKQRGYNSKDQNFDVIYVNGDNNLENLRPAKHTWQVRLTEEAFHRLMFDVEDV